MKKAFYIQTFLFVLLLNPLFSLAQNDDTEVLKTILHRYYKTEKPVYKGRSQLLYLYCNRANNNEEIFEAIKNRKLPDDFLNQIRNKVNTDFAEKDWSAELLSIYENDQTKLQQKINNCLSLEQYQEVSKRLNLNNQRFMIISKPLYYPKGNLALVKVVFYRNIEHNSGSILLLEKTTAGWQIKEYLSPWAT